MSAFGGLILTNKGRALQAKVQAGAVLHFNRIGIGDGNLASQSISDLNVLIAEKKSLAINKLKTQAGGKAIVGGVLANTDVLIGFYFREIGVFAQDPTDGEILYCYANSGAGAEYIPVGGGPDIVEKNIDIITLTGNAATVTATIASGIYAAVADVGDMSTVSTTSKVVAGAITELNTAIQNINPIPTDGSITPAKLSFDPATQVELDTLAGVGNTKTVKQLDDEAATHLADTAAQDTGGTGTAITLTMQGVTAYTDNYLLTFIASANNAGAATTININSLGAKSLYKPNTTTAPTLIVGKAYTVWYDIAGGNFFIKASAEGTAIAANVLAGTTFSSDIDTGITGLMIGRAGDTVALASSVSGTTLKLKASDGYRDGVNDNVTLTDADFIAANIKSGVNLFGIAGALVAGKLYMTGSVTSGASAIQFIPDSGATNENYFPLTVSGLNFPSGIGFILVRRAGSLTIYSINILSGTCNILMSNGNGSYWRLTGNAYVTTTGFQLPAQFASQLHTYEVWGV